MNKLTLCFFLAFSLVIATPVMAVDKDGNQYLTMGSASCGNWIEARKKNNDMAFGYEMWVLGYISAFSVTKGGAPKYFIERDANSMFLWVDKYCRQNPLDDTASASTHLAIKLWSGGKPHAKN